MRQDDKGWAPLIVLSVTAPFTMLNDIPQNPQLDDL